MSLEFIIALVFVLPIVAFITGFVWYINLKGSLAALKKTGSNQGTRNRRQ